MVNTSDISQPFCQVAGVRSDDGRRCAGARKVWRTSAAQRSKTVRLQHGADRVIGFSIWRPRLFGDEQWSAGRACASTAASMQRGGRPRWCGRWPRVPYS